MALKRVAMVKDGVVTNVSIWDGSTPWDPGDEYTLVDVSAEEKISIRDTFDGVDKFADVIYDVDGNAIIQKEYTGLNKKIDAVRLFKK